MRLQNFVERLTSFSIVLILAIRKKGEEKGNLIWIHIEVSMTDGLRHVMIMA